MTLQKLSRLSSSRLCRAFIVTTIIRKEQDMSAHAIDMTTETSNKSWKRGFWSIWATQFQESFSDLAYRWLVISFVTHMALDAETTREYLKALAGVLFAAPF